MTPHPESAEAANLPLWRRIADDLAGAIGRGEFAPGEALPTALALSERYGVHRHTVRQAFRHLAEQGLVSVEQGRGTFVTQQRIPYKLGRRVSFRDNLAAAGLPARGAMLESTVIAAPAQVAQALGIAPGTHVWEIRTLSEAGGRPMSTSLHYLEEARFPDFPARLLAGQSSITRAFESYGLGRYERLVTRVSARAATSIEARLLGLSEGAPVLHSSAIDGTQDRRPLQLVEAAFAADRMEMVVEPE